MQSPASEVRTVQVAFCWAEGWEGAGHQGRSSDVGLEEASRGGPQLMENSWAGASLPGAGRTLGA